MKDYKKYIKEGKTRSDLTNLYSNPEVFNSVINDMSQPFLDKGITKVVALDALGFVFGARISEKLNTGLVLARKKGKIEIESKSISFTDYTKKEKSLEIAVGVINKNDKVLMVDDWAETGAQLRAVASLVEEMGGTVVGATCFSIEKIIFEDPTLSKYRLHSVNTLR